VDPAASAKAPPPVTSSVPGHPSSPPPLLTPHWSLISTLTRRAALIACQANSNEMPLIAQNPKDRVILGLMTFGRYSTIRAIPMSMLIPHARP